MRKLKLLLVTLALIVGGVSSVWAHQTPTADGIYYLYNIACTDGTPGFMSTGNGYGFQVVIDDFGLPVKLISTGTPDTYKFQFIHHNGYLSDNGWMYSDGDEANRARTITVQDQGDGNYKLLNTNNGKEIEDWYGNVVGDGTGNRHNYLWKFLSKVERDAIVAGYTTNIKLAAATSMGMPASVDTEAEFDSYLSTNYIGLDQSSKIKNGTFDTSHNTEGWTTTANDNRGFTIGWGNIEPKNTPEVYEGAGAISQTITVDKVGLYKVSVNVTYRCGNSENNNRIGDMGYDGSVAYLKANNSIAKISDWYSGKINGNGPGNPSEANSTYFSAGKYLTEVYVYVGDTKTIEISLHSHAFTWGGWLMFNNFKLTYYSDEVSDEDATTILATATNLLEKEMDATIKENLTTEKGKFDGAHTVTNYNALQTAITAAQNSSDAYALFAPERTKALALGMTAEAIAALAPDVQALMVAEYNFVATEYPYAIELGYDSWSTKDNATENHGQHWDGTDTSTYCEQKEGWGSDSWSCDYSQNLTLPAGSYILKVAGRKSSDAATIAVTVKNGEDVIGTINDFPNGDKGKGIDTNGATNFGDGTYANNNEGRSWEWRYVKFTLAAQADVTIDVSGSATDKYQWIGFCNTTLLFADECDKILAEAYQIKNATEVPTVNVGTGAFQYDQGRITTYNTYAAQFAGGPDAIKALLKQYGKWNTTDMESLLNQYKSYVEDMMTLNQPTYNDHFYLVNANSEHPLENKAAVVIDGVTSDNNPTGYSIKATEDVSAQIEAFDFIWIKGNTYALGVKHGEKYLYLTYGSLNGSAAGWAKQQIQLTEDYEKWGEFTISATATEGVYNIYNTEFEDFIDIQDGGSLYTDTDIDKKNFKFERELVEVPMVVKAEYKWATFCAPFDVTIPEGVTAYTVDGVLDATEQTLNMTEVETTIPANTPVVLYSAKDVNETFTDNPNYDDDPQAGLLIGVYEKEMNFSDFPNDDIYLLSKPAGCTKVAFYPVEKETSDTHGATTYSMQYKAYLMIPGVYIGAKGLFFDEDEDVTAIEGVDVLTAGEYDAIYNAAGIPVETLQKGLNIVVKAGKSYKIYVK